MNLSLLGKRAVVCGSTAGIGRAAATELARLGASVVLLARDESRLRETLASLPAPDALAGATATRPTHGMVVVDLSTPEDVRRAAGEVVSRHGPAHILVNNTGGPPPGAVLDATPEAFASAMNAQLIAAHLLVQALVPGMKHAGFGRIVNVISTSVKQPIANLGVSNTARAAVANWAKTLSAELGPFGITVNNVLPGYTRTERLAALLSGRAKAKGISEQAAADELIATIPAGRFGQPEELGSAIAFLASPAAGYINGINLPVDGGRLGCL